jgi:2-polyprenyl-6-methoxyphenol hydroxylase-like FAD-dependent oxidoreductase
MAPLKVLISGGGVAGHAFAFWLSRLPPTLISSITVLEKWPTLRTQGLQIDLRGAGIAALRQMNLEAAFRAHAAPENGLEWMDRAGRQRAFFEANKSGSGAQSFTSEFEIMRGELCRIFMEGTKERDLSGGEVPGPASRDGRVHYLFGTSIVSYTETAAGVEVKLEDGTSDTYDLLVGADGLGSRVRRLMLHDGKAIPHGEVDTSFHPLARNGYAAFFTLKRLMKEGEDFRGSGYITTGRRFVLVRRHREDTIQVYLMTNGANPEFEGVKRGDVPAEKAAFAKVFKGAGWIVDELVKAMLEEANDFYCERQGLVRMDSWSSETGRVVLLGDAAHSFSANGYGTSAAMIDAYIMAGEVARGFGAKTMSFSANDKSNGTTHTNSPSTSTSTMSPTSTSTILKHAASTYERLRRPETTKMQREVENERSYLPDYEWAIEALTKVVALACWLKLDKLAMRYAPSERTEPLPDYSDVLAA